MRNQTFSQDIINQVANEIKKAIANNTDIVYDAGTPKRYKRRMNSGGIKDTSLMNVRTAYTNGGVDIIVTVNAKPNGKHWHYGNLAAAIENGYGSQDEWYNKPRKFLTAAQEDVDEMVMSGKFGSAAITSDMLSVGFIQDQIDSMIMEF